MGIICLADDSMKCQDLFSLKKKKKKNFFRMSSAAVVIDVLKVYAMFFFFFFFLFFFQITNDKEHRMSVFRHHFLHHPGTGGHIKEWKNEITLSKDIKWTLKTEKVWTWEQNAVGILVTFALAWVT